MDRVELSLDQLLLDLQNPRTGAVDTQTEALGAIIELDHRHFRTMMASIKDHGLDPGDSFYVIQSETNEDDYIVVDGNRRLAALMVLREPNLLQNAPISEALRNRLLTVADAFDPKTADVVSCVIFENRPQADEWILRRHGRGLEGESRIPWGTLEIQRFQRDRSVLDVIEFVARNSTFPEDRWAQIKQAIEDKPSVLRRFLESKPIIKLLGLSIETEGDERIPEFTASPETAVDILSQIVTDIADGDVDTRTHNKREDFQNYVDELPDKLKNPPQPGSAKKRFKDAEAKGPSVRPRQKAQPTKVDPTPTRKSKVRPPRPYLAPSKHPFAQPATSKGQRLLFEASRLKLRDTPLACAFLFRAFLEHTIDGHMHANGIAFYNQKGERLELKKRAQVVLDHLVQTGTAKKADLRGVERTLTNPTDPLSIQALNDYHHNVFHTPTGDGLRSAWDSAEALFIAVYGRA